MNRSIIRPYHPADLPAYYDICRLTGNVGGDATALFDDPYALGHVYVGPYVQRDPGLAFSACMEGRPVGYIVGTDDTEGFEDYFRSEWFPVLREWYPPGTGYRPIQRSHLEYTVWSQPEDRPDFIRSHPAHLHIDILPEGQGQGLGRRLVDALLDRLVERGCPGIHFGVLKENAAAVGFYRRLGFADLADFDEVVFLGKMLIRGGEGGGAAAGDRAAGDSAKGGGAAAGDRTAGDSAKGGGAAAGDRTAGDSAKGGRAVSTPAGAGSTADAGSTGDSEPRSGAGSAAGNPRPDGREAGAE